LQVRVLPGPPRYASARGSGMTAVAADNADRLWICIERDQDDATKAMQRSREHEGEADDWMPDERQRETAVVVARRSGVASMPISAKHRWSDGRGGRSRGLG
jgi:hypothetical protein